MFYLKYRPQIIEHIDNSAIRERLKTILASTSIPHAFLLTGTKGAGKTSTARIIAKAINCEKNKFAEKGESIEPCNECEICKSITQGNALDIIEMDAASNRKIDEMRELIDKVKFKPVYARYKVYIIDEVHMLTTESFNALLKTLEEPPESTIFILATTEIEKLPKTIVSRCVHLNFGKAEIPQIVSMLKRISKAEKIEIQDDELTLIATYSDHSFRDATKLLEEAFTQKAFTSDELKKLLRLPIESFDLLKLLEQKDAKTILTHLETYSQESGDFKTLTETLLHQFHQILLQKNDLKTNLTQSYEFSLKECTLAIKLLQEAYLSMKVSPIESLPLELAIVEYVSISKK